MNRIARIIAVALIALGFAAGVASPPSALAGTLTGEIDVVPGNP